MQNNDITQIVKTIAEAGSDSQPSPKLAALVMQAQVMMAGSPSYEAAGLRAGWCRLSAQDEHPRAFFHATSERFENFGDWDELCSMEGIEPLYVKPTAIEVVDENGAGAVEFDETYVIQDYVVAALQAGAVCDERGWYHKDAVEDLNSGAIVAYASAKDMCDDLDVGPYPIDHPFVVQRGFAGAILVARTVEIDGSDLAANLTPGLAPKTNRPSGPSM